MASTTYNLRMARFFPQLDGLNHYLRQATQKQARQSQRGLCCPQTNRSHVSLMGSSTQYTELAAVPARDVMRQRDFTICRQRLIAYLQIPT